jgi:hypothetical protein
VAHEEARQPPPHFSGGHIRRAFKKRTENDPRLQAGECGPDTEARALAEGDVALTAGSVESELVGIVEVQWIVRVVSLAYCRIVNSKIEHQILERF